MKKMTLLVLAIGTTFLSSCSSDEATNKLEGSWKAVKEVQVKTMNGNTTTQTKDYDYENCDGFKTIYDNNKFYTTNKYLYGGECIEGSLSGTYEYKNDTITKYYDNSTSKFHVVKLDQDELILKYNREDQPNTNRVITTTYKRMY